MPIDLQDRFRGCLLGLALGDALGAPFEGEPANFITTRYPTRELLFEKLTEETRYYTDDAQMMIGVAEALAQDGEILEPTLRARFAANYVPHRGYGRGARKVLEAMEEGEDYQTIAEKMFPGGSFGNGAAMRVAPVGLLF